MGIRKALTLGKFAPLHRGHQLVIETALAETDEVSVIIYDCPETTDVPLPVRAAWIRSLYPGVRVIESWDGPTEVGNTPEIQRMHEDYVIHRLGICGITHFYSSEFYGEHMSRALGAIDRRVDPERTRQRISGTVIRSDPYAYREYLHPVVYRDLITHVVFLGAPSTGKTTIARRLAEAYRTVWMPEYGREYWERHQIDRRLTPEQLVEIAEGHREREDRLSYRANRYLFVDTNALTTRVFAQYYHGSALPRLEELADRCAARYDLIFFCEKDIPYDDTWDRSGSVQREAFHRRIVADLAARRLPYVTLRGDLETRVATVKQALSRFRKYGNLIDAFSDASVSGESGTDVG